QFKQAAAAYEAKIKRDLQEKAVRYWEFASANESELCQARAKLADCYYFDHKFKEAEPYFSAVASAIANGLQVNNSGVLAMFESKCADEARRLGKFDDAKSIYRMACNAWQ